MNRIDDLFTVKKREILSIYFTAGYPELNTTAGIIESLSAAGADMIEIGIPFSDPVADGPQIQNSNRIALKNGMNLKLLFEQLANIRRTTDIPLIIMSYVNPVLKFGIGNFCKSCAEAGIDGLILPDLPFEEYKEHFQKLFRQNGLCNILMISPRTDRDRIKDIDSLSRGFIYMVSSSSTTGVKNGFSPEQLKYFARIHEMRLRNPCLTGFGIAGKDSFREACNHSAGAIVGSAFIKMIGEKGIGRDGIKDFISSFRLKSQLHHRLYPE